MEKVILNYLDKTYRVSHIDYIYGQIYEKESQESFYYSQVLGNIIVIFFI